MRLLLAVLVALLLVGCQQQMSANDLYAALGVVDDPSTATRSDDALDRPPAPSTARWFEIRARLGDLRLVSELGSEEIEIVRRMQVQMDGETFERLDRLTLPKGTTDTAFATVGYIPVDHCDRVSFVKIGYIIVERDSGALGNDDIFPEPTVQVDQGIPLTYDRNVNFFEHVVFLDCNTLQELSDRRETGLVETYARWFEFFDSEWTPRRARFESYVQVVLQ